LYEEVYLCHLTVTHWRFWWREWCWCW